MANRNFVPNAARPCRAAAGYASRSVQSREKEFRIRQTKCVRFFKIMDLSIIIPSRNEEFLPHTIDNILKNLRGETEIIVVLDGYWPETGIKRNDRVNIIHFEKSVGQRAAVNYSARLSAAKYIMKLDAHCSVDQGFDIKLMSHCEPDWTVIPRMYNLHAFDWECAECGHLSYQGPKPDECENFDWKCKSCGFVFPQRFEPWQIPPKCGRCQSKSDFEKINRRCNNADQTKFIKKIVYEPRWNKRNDFMRFDQNMKFQYWRAYNKRPESKGDIVDLMSSVGACFFMHRDRFFELGGMDEDHGSWGQFGTEIACKSWLSGGRHVVNKKTWFAHMFRTNNRKDWGFPYQIKISDQEAAQKYSRNLWLNDKWPGAKRPLSWIIEKFSPVPGWEDERKGSGPPQKRRVKIQGVEGSREDQAASSDSAVTAETAENGDIIRKPSTDPAVADPISSSQKITKGIVYYTDNRCEERIAGICRLNIAKIARSRFETVYVSQFPIPVENNIVMPIERSIYSQARQILAGLKALDSDIVFLCEHDILYHPSHFDFIPPEEDRFYYNQNRWPVCAKTGQAVFYLTKALSHCCAYRGVLIEHYEKRVEVLAETGYKSYMGHSPGSRRNVGFGDHGTGVWFSEHPNIDIRHATNYTKNRFSIDQFRKRPKQWTESNYVPFWGRTKGRFDEFMIDIAEGLRS
jgi:glycosyltransferase involved in cell wall biosynthesis